MTPTPYLFFAGNCREAMTRYAEILGVEAPEIMSASDMSPEDLAEMPGMPEDAVMHATLLLGGGRIFGSDDMPGTPPVMSGCNVHLALEDEGRAREVFDALADGGEVRMPLQATSWSAAFGTLSDRYGIRWMIDVAPAGG